MIGDEFDPKELTKEKKLWDIYVSSRRIPLSKFNALSTIIVILLLIIHSWLTTQSVYSTAEIVRKYAENGLSIFLSTLGFLLAGFTIFATVSKPSLSLAMAKVRHEESGLSYLKYNYFIFLRVFIYYIAFASFCLFVVMFGHSGGLASLLVQHSHAPDILRFCLVKGSYVLLFAGYFFLVMQLKSFIFNIYNAVMTALRWEAEGQKEEDV